MQLMLTHIAGTVIGKNVCQKLASSCRNAISEQGRSSKENLKRIYLCQMNAARHPFCGYRMKRQSREPCLEKHSPERIASGSLEFVSMITISNSNEHICCEWQGEVPYKATERRGLELWQQWTSLQLSLEAACQDMSDASQYHCSLCS